MIREKRINDKFIKSFLDLIVIAVLSRSPTHGYEVIAIVHREFGILLSPGSLYPLIHSLEAREMIKSSLLGEGKIVYVVTPKGKQEFNRSLSLFKHAVNTILSFLSRGSKEVVPDV